MSDIVSRWINTTIVPNETPSHELYSTPIKPNLDPSISFLFVGTKAHERLDAEVLARVILNNNDIEYYGRESQLLFGQNHRDDELRFFASIWGRHNHKYFSEIGEYRYNTPIGGQKVAETIKIQIDAFAEVWHQENIILERSPPKLESLVTILKDAPGIAIGAYIGIQSGVSYPPLMLLTVPTGIILCGAAFGVACALRDGLRARLTKLTTGFGELSPGDIAAEAPQVTASEPLAAEAEPDVDIAAEAEAELDDPDPV